MRLLVGYREHFRDAPLLLGAPVAPRHDRPSFADVPTYGSVPLTLRASFNTHQGWPARKSPRREARKGRNNLVYSLKRDRMRLNHRRACSLVEHVPHAQTLLRLSAKALHALCQSGPCGSGSCSHRLGRFRARKCWSTLQSAELAAHHRAEQFPLLALEAHHLQLLDRGEIGR